jgi:CHAT domain-containing protein
MGPVEDDLEQAQGQTRWCGRWTACCAMCRWPRSLMESSTWWRSTRWSTITPASIRAPGRDTRCQLGSPQWREWGSRSQYQTDLPELPSVVGELDHVVRDPQVKGAVGVLPGQVLLNDAFTEKAMEDELAGQHTVVHIASHFVFFPGGDDQQSYLLLADGTTKDKAFHLTVADFRDNQNLTLADTELLTLSACQTGMSAVASNGREVDGLGTTAQVKASASSGIHFKLTHYLGFQSGNQLSSY